MGMNEPRAGEGFDFNKPTIVALVWLVGAITALPAIIAPILAYIWKGEAHPAWMSSHYSYHIRTLWIGIAYAIIAVPLILLLGLGLLIFALLPVWIIIRALIALAAAQRHQPVERPGSWLF